MPLSFGWTRRYSAELVFEALNGQVVEISRNFSAQTDGGTVCYFGEDVDIYDATGEMVSHAGAWRADGHTRLLVS